MKRLSNCCEYAFWRMRTLLSNCWWCPFSRMQTLWCPLSLTPGVKSNLSQKVHENGLPSVIVIDDQSKGQNISITNKQQTIHVRDNLNNKECLIVPDCFAYSRSSCKKQTLDYIIRIVIPSTMNASVCWELLLFNQSSCFAVLEYTIATTTYSIEFSYLTRTECLPPFVSLIDW
jgi:hypothetical protein